MLFNKSRSRRPHFGGLRHGYCENRDCPTRKSFTASSETRIRALPPSARAASTR